MSGPSSTSKTVMAASLVAGALIAQQVGGKATRDALFLSQFDVSALPTMMVASALVSIVAVRLVLGRDPSRLVPLGLTASGLLLLAEWALASAQPRVVAVALYMHVAVFGSVLISGFWSLITDRLDPYTARHSMGRIATGASIGAVAGGLMVERIGALFTVTAALPLLAVLHLACAALVLPLRQGGRQSQSRRAKENVGLKAGIQVLGRLPYLRHLAYLVFLGAVSAALLDFAFKAQVAESLGGGESMMRFFALFYTGAGIVTLILQSALSRRSLERFGIAGTASSLPIMVVAGSLGMMAVPGLGGAVAGRGVEAIFRNSMFRPAYELFYTPVAAKDKRATKTLIDVLWERLGDALGGVSARALLLLGPLAARSAILSLAAALGLAAMWICRKLHREYVEALEASLMQQLPQPVEGTILDSLAHTALLQNRETMQLQSVLFTVAEGLGGASPIAEEAPAAFQPDGAVPDKSSGVGQAIDDLPVLRDFTDLCSTEPSRVRRALNREPLEPLLVPQAILLLASDELVQDVARALEPIASRIVGQLGDALTDPDSEFVLRRRIPVLLGASSSERAVAPLLAGLDDGRFEVRYRCARALDRLAAREIPLTLDREVLATIVLREIQADQRLLASLRDPDPAAEPAEGPARTEDLRGGHKGEQDAQFYRLLHRRAWRRLKQIFTLLGLGLPREPLKVAFRGLRTEDQHLRGTALEYLDSILPAEIRTELWPYLTTASVPKRGTRSSEEIAEDLMRSSVAIDSKLGTEDSDE